MSKAVSQSTPTTVLSEAVTPEREAVDTLTAELDSLRSEIQRLEAQTPQLTAQRDEAQAAVTQLRGAVRAGTSPLTDLVQAEAVLLAGQNLLTAHLEELTSTYALADEFVAGLDQAHHAERLANLLKGRDAVLLSREEAEVAFVLDVREGLRALHRINHELSRQALEIVTLRRLLKPHAPTVTDDVYSDSRSTGSHYEWQHRLWSGDTTDGFRAFITGGGLSLLMDEIGREEADA